MKINKIQTTWKGKYNLPYYAPNNTAGTLEQLEYPNILANNFHL